MCPLKSETCLTDMAMGMRRKLAPGTVPTRRQFAGHTDTLLSSGWRVSALTSGYGANLLEKNLLGQIFIRTPESAC